LTTERSNIKASGGLRAEVANHPAAKLAAVPLAMVDTVPFRRAILYFIRVFLCFSIQNTESGASKNLNDSTAHG
jgi:hypothetical protein